MSNLPVPVPVENFYEAGKQWTLPIPIRRDGKRFNLDGYQITATAQPPKNGIAFGVQIAKRDPQSDPDNEGIADAVITALQTTDFDGKWELRVFVEGEPAGWYRWNAQEAL